MEDLIVEQDPYAVEEEVAEPLPDIEQLLIDLRSPDVNCRMLAARVFSEVEEPRAVPALIDLLVDDCPLVRVSAAYALGRNPCAQAVEPLVAALERDWNGYVRKGLVWALGNCRDSRAFGPLVEALDTDIPAVRLWAASALGQLGDRRALVPLGHALLGDPLAVVRSNCAWALGELADPRAVPSLVQVLDDEDLSVQQDAREALGKLGYHFETEAFEL
jgi:HEAT repeat protein